jgi:uncharacterized protein (TIGR00255 family)
MTGFGRAGGAALGRQFSVEVRTVNHRFLDIKLRTPFADPAFEALITQEIRRRVERGAVAVNVRDEGAIAGQTGSTGLRRVRADIGLAQDYRAALEELRSALGLEGAIPLALVAEQEGVLVSGEAPPDPEALFGAIRPALDQALNALGEMREREGAALAADLGARLAEIMRLMQSVSRIAANAPDQLRKRIEERLARSLPANVVDPSRIAQEVAMLAERADVTEELTRLDSHRAQMETLLQAKNPVGRRIDFLLQEMGREVNTIGSKAQDGEIAACIVAAKAELEKFREQVQNIE